MKLKMTLALILAMAAAQAGTSPAPTSVTSPTVVLWPVAGVGSTASFVGIVGTVPVMEWNGQAESRRWSSCASVSAARQEIARNSIQNMK